MSTPVLGPLSLAYNTGAGGGILRTICIVRKYFTQQNGFTPFLASKNIRVTRGKAEPRGLGR
jgi:hypothetical protein